MKVLVIDDNPILREHLRRQFLKVAIIDTADTAAEALEKAGGDYGVIILDLGLPDMPGLKVCNSIRSAGIETPIIVLTAEADVVSRVTLLNAGADDYLIKPFHGEELRARVRALTRRTPHIATLETVRLGDLTLNRDDHTVRRTGTSIYLTRKEFSILEYLLLNQGHVITRDMIFDRAWADESDGSHNKYNLVDVHIKRLRDKIDRPFGYPLIQTAHGIGYIMMVPEPVEEKAAHGGA